jgi:hypothetical protein
MTNPALLSGEWVRSHESNPRWSRVAASQADTRPGRFERFADALRTAKRPKRMLLVINGMRLKHGHYGRFGRFFSSLKEIGGREEVGQSGRLTGIASLTNHEERARRSATGKDRRAFASASGLTAPDSAPPSCWNDGFCLGSRGTSIPLGGTRKCKRSKGLRRVTPATIAAADLQQILQQFGNRERPQVEHLGPFSVLGRSAIPVHRPRATRFDLGVVASSASQSPATVTPIRAASREWYLHFPPHI